MTLDQAFMVLADRKLIRRTPGGPRRMTMSPMQAASMAKDGMLKGVAADGTPIRGRVRGKSRARELMEQEERKRKERESKPKRRGRRGRSGN